MKARLATPFADTCAADLTLAYGLAPLPALGTHRVDLPGVRVELRVLGASHQVVVELPGPELPGPGRPQPVVWSETVACLPDRPGGLPGRDATHSARLRSRFTARVLRLGAEEFADRVQAVRRRYDPHPGALVGTFPGSPLAVTALVVRAHPCGGASWLTWHAYPQSGELVRTTGAVMRR